MTRSERDEKILHVVTSVSKWFGIGVWVGFLSGSASALFLWLLEHTTDTFAKTPSLIYWLPIVGAVTGLVYSTVGSSVSDGTNILISKAQTPDKPVPWIMAPLILVATLLAHLCGASVGREGTAVQMGGSLADLIAKPFRMSEDDRRRLLKAGIAGGFGAVFGTPLAGAIFGLEVPNPGRFKLDAIVPCLIASITGDLVCRGWGIHHHFFAGPAAFTMTPLIGFTLIGLAILVSLCTVGYCWAVKWIHDQGKRLAYADILRPAFGGVLIVIMTIAVGNRSFNGLGLDLIDRTLHGDVLVYAFAVKLLFTVVAVGSGLKGGEVTPLFCVGATLGGALGFLTGQDPALYATVGFVSVFAAASKTPLACTIMGVELFGAPFAMPIGLVCVMSYVLSGKSGLYSAQRHRHRDSVGHSTKHHHRRHHHHAAVDSEVEGSAE